MSNKELIDRAEAFMVKAPYLPLGLAKEMIAALKEQEPLIIKKDDIDEVYDYIAECPECGMTWAMWHPDRMRYCPGCGRAVKWDEND